MATLTTTHDQKDNNPWARLISNLLSPPVIWGALAFPIAYREARTASQGLTWALTYVLLVCIAPAAYVAFMVWRGQITDLHMRVRSQRIRPLIVTILCAVLAVIAFLLMQTPSLLIVFTLITIVQMVVMLGITFFWQISMHTVSVSSAIVATAALFGLSTALIASPLIPIVGAARYTLRRHTLSQLVAGVVVGGGLTLVLLAVLQTA